MPIGGGQPGARDCPRAGAPVLAERRRLLCRDLYLAMRRSVRSRPCRTCELFALMARVCLEEAEGLLCEEERRDLSTWAEAAPDGPGCEGACPVVPVYARLAL